MKLSKNRYTFTLGAQLTLLMCDLAFNTFYNHFTSSHNLLLLIFVLQDFLQVFGLVLTLITFFQTNVFQAGFVALLYETFWPILFTSLSYLFLSVILHTWTTIVRWNYKNSNYIYWPFGLNICFVIHRLVSSIHYYVYKRTALRISDQRLYEDEWITHQVHHKINI